MRALHWDSVQAALPGVYFSYDISSLKVELTERRGASVLRSIARVCAVRGGNRTPRVGSAPARDCLESGLSVVRARSSWAASSMWRGWWTSSSTIVLASFRSNAWGSSPDPLLTRMWAAPRLIGAHTRAFGVSGGRATAGGVQPQGGISRVARISPPDHAHMHVG
jgi:hypothetical protein